eukprot:27993_1
MNETNIAKPTEQDIVTRIVNAIELDVSFLFSSFNSQSKVFRAILSPNPNSNINISSLQTTLLKILKTNTNTKWNPYTNNRAANPRPGKSFPKHSIISSSTSYDYRVQGSKSLFRNKDNDQRGWIAKGVYGAISGALDKQCFIIVLSSIALFTIDAPPLPNIPPLDAVTTDNDDDIQLINDRTRRRAYIPSSDEQKHSPSFEAFISSTNIKQLNDVHEQDTYFEGWMYIDEDSDVDDFLWIYQHQTKTVYVRRKDNLAKSKDNAKKNKMKKLYYREWCKEGELDGKWIKQIRSDRYDCQRAGKQQTSRPRKTNKPAIGSIKRFEQQQRDALQQRTEAVIARKEEQMKKIPEHMKFDSEDEIDLNETISNNYQNTRTSSRAIRPSSAMLESMKYQKRMNGQPQ